MLAAAIQDGRDTFVKQGQEPGGGSVEELGNFVRSELARYESVARRANIGKQ